MMVENITSYQFLKKKMKDMKIIKNYTYTSINTNELNFSSFFSVEAEVVALH